MFTIVADPDSAKRVNRGVGRNWSQSSGLRANIGTLSIAIVACRQGKYYRNTCENDDSIILKGLPTTEIKIFINMFKAIWRIVRIYGNIGVCILNPCYYYFNTILWDAQFSKL